MTLQEQITKLEALDDGRTKWSAQSIECIESNYFKAEFKFWHNGNDTPPSLIDCNFYLSAPQMMKVIREQQRLLALAEEALDCANLYYPIPPYKHRDMSKGRRYITEALTQLKQVSSITSKLFY